MAARTLLSFYPAQCAAAAAGGFYVLSRVTGGRSRAAEAAPALPPPVPVPVPVPQVPLAAAPRVEAAAEAAAAPAAPVAEAWPGFAAGQALIYKEMLADPEYDDLGQVRRQEATLTVAPNAFTQIGVVTPAGVAALAASDGGALPWPNAPLDRRDVFVDIGSGVGNVCLQVLADTPVAKAVGVELLPSRLEFAEKAAAELRRRFPAAVEGKEAVWVKEDAAACGPGLAAQGATVVFTHSWMFDDALMAELGKQLRLVQSLRCVVSSRAVPGLEAQLPVVRTAAFEADWNPESPFFVYTKQ